MDKREKEKENTQNIQGKKLLYIKFTVAIILNMFTLTYTYMQKCFKLGMP
jgi:hypothetical protein